MVGKVESKTGDPVIAILIVFGLLGLVSSCNDDVVSDVSLGGSTYTTCRIQDPVPGPPVHAWALVNTIQFNKMVSTGDDDDETIICSILNKDFTEEKFIEMEIVVAGNPPSTISVQIPSTFSPELESSVIVCSYKNIGPRNRVYNKKPLNTSQTKENGSYVCDNINGLQFVFTEIDRDVPIDSVHKRVKHSADTKNEKEEPMLDTRCAKFSVKPNATLDTLGKWCVVSNSDPEIARRWMFNESGLPDCLPCCVNYYWDMDKEQCEKCRPGSEQRKKNVWPHCVHVHQEKSEKSKDPPVVPALVEPTTSATPLPDHPAPQSPTPVVETKYAEPEIKRPNLAPSGLHVSKVGMNDARIDWTPVESLEHAPVTKYKVTIVHLDWENGRHIETEGKETGMMIADLKPSTHYAVKIHAGNLAGFGPASESLIFNTLDELRAPKDITHHITKDGFVDITWTPTSGEKDLKTRVEYWADEVSHGQKYVLEFDSRDKASFRLLHHALYNMQIRYVTEHQLGPTSQVFQVEYQEESKVLMTFLYVIIGCIFLAGTIACIIQSCS